MSRNIVIIDGKYYPQEDNGAAHKFGLLTSKKKDGEWINTFYDCVAFDRAAARLKEFFKKGNAVCITGRLSKSEWEKDGQKRSKIEIVVSGSDFPPKDSPNTDDGAQQKFNPYSD